MYTRTVVFAAVAIVSAAGVLLATNSFVRAQTDTAYKLGVVEMDLVVQGYRTGRDQAAALREQFGARETQVRQQLAQLEVRRDAFREEAARLSADQRLARTQAIEDSLYELQQQMRRIESDHARDLQRLELRLRRDIQLAIDSIATEENYHLIFQRTNDETSDIVYASPALNLTPKLIDRLNQ